MLIPSPAAGTPTHADLPHAVRDPGGTGKSKLRTQRVCRWRSGWVSTESAPAAVHCGHPVITAMSATLTSVAVSGPSARRAEPRRRRARRAISVRFWSGQHTVRIDLTFQTAPGRLALPADVCVGRRCGARPASQLSRHGHASHAVRRHRRCPPEQHRQVRVSWPARFHSCADVCRHRCARRFNSPTCSSRRCSLSLHRIGRDRAGTPDCEPKLGAQIQGAWRAPECGDCPGGLRAKTDLAVLAGPCREPVTCHDRETCPVLPHTVWIQLAVVR
jgi:hypothetical protein